MNLQIVKIILINFCLSSLLSLALSFVILFKKAPHLAGLLIFGDFLLLGLLSLASLTILLARRREVYNDKISSFFAFFLLPAVVAASLLFVAGEDFVFYSINVLSFFLILMISFLRFHKAVKLNE